MNVPNMLTMSRFVLIPLFLFFYFNDQTITALSIVLVAGLTDFLDGYIARKSGQVTVTGSMLDPLADKLMMLAVVVALLIKSVLPLSAFLVMAFRELVMIIGSAIYHFRGLKTVPANLFGKVTTILYYVAILLLFLELRGGVTVFWCGIVLSFLTSVIYFMKFKSINQTTT
ncbi:CDP-diacylglycerol--glycerol-3-phosphate 3-phosphatidyltransferase [Cohnella abietis]|uniref:CDP-diacylglycerol--glycerol-3-phosphate 3-phosphatidyltransferase n=1 Tax=Cohnella abietis TaxID=2507935 RepID=A0A3T1DDL9_9BACL|nr:CDP-diacylglycerol--glycerol-3-phosphate 3-phosphatidyltransferase [Cohnella abietis]BBI36197.1 CDP-diacylglycerol--glycerol-3-phosphate 3-phosphatidyltransferase [Cohnella abietis]